MPCSAGLCETQQTLFSEVTTSPFESVGQDRQLDGDFIRMCHCHCHCHCLIPSASTGEPKAFYSEKKDDCYRFPAERATGDAKRQAPMIQKVLKTVEAPQMQYIDRIVDLPVVMQRRVPTIQTAQRTVEVPQTIEVLKIVSQDRIPQQTAEQFVDIPVPQVTEEIIEMFNVLSQDRVQQRNVEQIAETPKTQTQEKNICCLKLDQSEFLEELIIEKSDVPVPHVIEKTIGVVKLIPQEQAQNRSVRQITDVPVPRVMKENTEVEMLKLTSILISGCAAQAPE